jgi:hypothetical protein
MIKGANAIMRRNNPDILPSFKAPASKELDEFPGSATVIACQKCRVLFIEPRAFLDRRSHDPMGGRRIL